MLFVCFINGGVRDVEERHVRLGSFLKLPVPDPELPWSLVARGGVNRGATSVPELFRGDCPRSTLLRAAPIPVRLIPPVLAALGREPLLAMDARSPDVDLLAAGIILATNIGPALVLESLKLLW